MQDMDEAFGTIEERAVWKADEVGVAKSAVLGLEDLSFFNFDRVDVSRTQVYE